MASKKVRIIARIRGPSNPESGSLDKPLWISSHRPDDKTSSDRVIISFDQTTSCGKQCYELDEIYDQKVGNSVIFEKELKGLVSALFEGNDVTVFGYGATSTGKTFTIQGSEYDPGLASLAMDVILSRAQESGNSVTISLFENYQDRISDLLDPKKSEVSVFEDAQGKIRLKGLSKVNVKSISEFQKMYLGVRKPLQKTANETPRRSHRGLIIHLLSTRNENPDSRSLVAKMNFVDLAGFVDSKRKSTDGYSLIETTKINKSLYAIHNVLYALNANETHVPFRETKLTRMLQDSLGGRNQILMVTCMNPSFCQDTIQTISLASRSCLASNRTFADSAKKSKSRAFADSAKRCKSTSKATVKTPSSMNVTKTSSISASTKKQTGSRLRVFEKKPVSASMVKGRKLFNEADESKNTVQEKSILDVSPKTISSRTEVVEEVKHVLDLSSDVQSSEAAVAEEKFNINASSDSQLLSTEVIEEKISPSAVRERASSTHKEKDNALQIDRDIDNATSVIYNTPTVVSSQEDKENKSFSINEGRSQPLYVKLLAMKNDLKSMMVQSESSLKMARENDTSTDCVKASHEIHEPISPNVQPGISHDIGSPEIHEPITLNVEPGLSHDITSHEILEDITLNVQSGVSGDIISHGITKPSTPNVLPGLNSDIVSHESFKPIAPNVQQDPSRDVVSHEILEPRTLNVEPGLSHDIISHEILEDITLNVQSGLSGDIISHGITKPSTPTVLPGLSSDIVSHESFKPIAANVQQDLSRDVVSHEILEPRTPTVKPVLSHDMVSNGIYEPRSPIQPVPRIDDQHGYSNMDSPWGSLQMHSSCMQDSPWGSLQMRSSCMKNSLANELLKFLNSASKEELQKLKGIGEKRATYILELRDESPEPFKSLDDLKDIGLPQKNIQGLMKNVAAELWS